MKHPLPTVVLPAMLVFLSLLYGCREDYFHTGSKPITDQAWPAEETKSFGFPVDDTTALYSFMISLRITTDYEFSNLYLFMNTIYPDQSISRDTIELVLARPDGQWLGKGTGYYRDNLFLFKRNATLPLEGNYRLEFVQAMRRDTLYGLDELGIRIVKESYQTNE